MKLAVLVSGNGSNLQAIIDNVNSGKLINIAIKQVIADRYCYALERALEYDIPAYMVEDRANASQEILDLLNPDIELIVLAGFLSILSDEFFTKFKGKIINLHPSLLPKYGGKGMYGKYVHQAVLNNHETESGATIHYVIPEVDKGKIIAQRKVTVSPNDTVETLSEKIHVIEHELIVEALQKISE